MRKSIIFAIAISLLMTGFCLAQEEETESITITTYYPAPAGVYKQMRLHPTDDIDPAAACSNKGEMYYDDSDNQVYICNGSTWQALGGGLPIDITLVTCDVPQSGSCTATCPADRVAISAHGCGLFYGLVYGGVTSFTSGYGGSATCTNSAAAGGGGKCHLYCAK